MDYGYGNQYSTAYGAQGAADGGGFVAGEPQSSPAAGRGGYAKDTVRPVTIKQILDAQQPHPDADFRVDQEAISQITFVGQIRSISTQPTNVTYKIDDGTGLVEVKQWIDSDANQDDMDVDGNKSRLVEDGYCRVWGRLKAFNNKRHVGAHVIRPITDYNEINYHLLEATAVHLLFTRGPPPNVPANGQKDNATNGINGGQQNYSGGAGSHLARVSPLARRLEKAMQDSPIKDGLHANMLMSQMGATFDQVHEAAMELVSVGIIYETIDDYTWALLEHKDD